MWPSQGAVHHVASSLPSRRAGAAEAEKMKEAAKAKQVKSILNGLDGMLPQEFQSLEI